jgi:hypothetical protein
MAAKATPAKATSNKADNSSNEDTSDELRQVNIRLSKKKMRLVDRLVARKGLTLAGYFDQLVSDDIRREQAAILADFEEQQERARLEAEAFKRDLEGDELESRTPSSRVPQKP